MYRVPHQSQQPKKGVYMDTTNNISQTMSTHIQHTPEQIIEKLTEEIELLKDMEEFSQYKEDLLIRFIYCLCSDVYRDFLYKSNEDILNGKSYGRNYNKIESYQYFKDVLKRSIREDESFIKERVEKVIQDVVFKDPIYI